MSSSSPTSSSTAAPPSPPPPPPKPSRPPPSPILPPPLPFSLSRTWGDSSKLPQRAVHTILLAEFDLKTGSTLRHQIPEPIAGYDPDWFAEKMLPEGAHNRENDSTWFFLNSSSPTLDEQDLMTSKNHQASAIDDSATITTATSSTSSPPRPSTGEDQPRPPFLYCLNTVRTKHDSSVRRGALVKAMAICSPYHFVQFFRAPMLLALDLYFKTTTPEEGILVLQKLYDTLNNGLDICKIPRPTVAERNLMKRGVATRSIHDSCPVYTPKNWNYHTHIMLDNHRLPISLPLHLSSDDAGDRSIVQLARTFGEDTMRIYNAILMCKRVLFVGYNHSAADVCRFVLTAASLISPPFSGIIRRVCPYSSLSDLGFLEIPGYIAGVTNPMFETREDWWDLLCVLDLPQGKGKCYMPGEKAEEEKEGVMGGGERKLQSEGEALTQEVDSLFFNKIRSGVDARLGEDWVRSMFTDHAQTLLDFALDGYPQTKNSRAREDGRKLVRVNAQRIKAMKTLPEYANIDPNPFHAIPNLPVRGDILRSHLRLMELHTQVTKQEAEKIFADLSKALQSEAAVQIFLAQFPESKYGLLRIASALLHPYQPVRFYACLLLQRLEFFESTRPAVYCLNKLLLMAYRRVTEEMTSFT